MPSSPNTFVEPLESRRLMDSTMPLQPMWDDNVASMTDLLVTNSTSHMRWERGAVSEANWSTVIAIENTAA